MKQAMTLQSLREKYGQTTSSGGVFHDAMLLEMVHEFEEKTPPVLPEQKISYDREALLGSEGKYLLLTNVFRWA